MDPQPSASDTPPELTILAEQLNETLRLGGATSGEQAFGLSCSIGLLPILLVILGLFFLQVINLILAFILLVMALLAMTGVAMLTAQRARQNGIQRVYRTDVHREIVQYLVRTGLTRSQFDRLVSEILPVDAPLQAFLTDKENA